MPEIWHTMHVNPSEEQKTVYFAKTNFRGADRTFGIRTDDRRQHMYVIGKTGTGKTNLLKTLALQDIENGDGVAIVDPHGSFVEEVLDEIPEHRIDDVVYVNPVDTDFPVAFNVLEISDPQYKHLVASDLMGIFTKIWANVWSARMEHILNNCVLALLDTPGSTLLGIPRLLVDKDYREYVINNIKDPVVRSFWTQEYEGYTDRLRSEAIVPIQNKVGQFLSSVIIRNVVGQPKSSISISQIMENKKILLINVSKGRIGEDNAGLLGAMFITKIQLASMERIRIPEHLRKDFYLYVDEFQNFATDSFADILSEARKFRLCLTLAHQYIGQLVTDTSTRVRDAVFGNCGTLTVFRVGASDAEFLENEFAPEFTTQDLVNLPNRNIYIKLMVDGVTSRPFSASTVPAPKREDGQSPIDRIVQRSREQFARPRVEVEAEIESWSRSIGEEVRSTQSQGGDKHGSNTGASSGNGQSYTATCQNCGKTAHLPFKPDGSRPVYCAECKKQNMEQPLYKETLSSLGIGGNSGGAKKSRTPRREMGRSQSSSIPKIQSSTPVRRNDGGEKRVSLQSLGENTKKIGNGKSLRDALKEALGNKQQPSSKDTQGEQKNVSVQGGREQQKEHHSKNSKRTHWRPGEKVKMP